MAKVNMVQITMRGNVETKDLFRELFESSGANSHGEFLQKLLETYAQVSEQPPVQQTREPNIIEVEKPLAENQMILNLNPLQFFALRQAVLSSPDFAEQQNIIIDSLKRGKPWYYAGNLYDVEFVNAFLRNVSLSKAAPEEREKIITLNMAAFLINFFMMNAIDENITTIKLKASQLKAFVKKQIEEKKKSEQPINISTQDE